MNKQQELFYAEERLKRMIRDYLEAGWIIKDFQHSSSGIEFAKKINILKEEIAALQVSDTFPKEKCKCDQVFCHGMASSFESGCPCSCHTVELPKDCLTIKSCNGCSCHKKPEKEECATCCKIQAGECDCSCHKKPENGSEAKEQFQFVVENDGKRMTITRVSTTPF